jgi:hypothetical protein
MSPTLSRYLKDFGAEQRSLPPVIPDMSFPEEQIFPEVHEPAPIDVDAERREAYAEGHEAATLALFEKHRANIEAITASHQEELASIQARHVAEMADRIVSGLRDIAMALGQTVGSEVAGALAPVLTEALTSAAVEDLAGLVSAAILDGAVGPIAVSGPAALFESLNARIGEHGALLRHVEADDVDLTVTIGESVLVTRMSAWADSLREVLQ